MIVTNEKYRHKKLSHRILFRYDNFTSDWCIKRDSGCAYSWNRPKVWGLGRDPCGDKMNDQEIHSVPGPAGVNGLRAGQVVTN